MNSLKSLRDPFVGAAALLLGLSCCLAVAISGDWQSTVVFTAGVLSACLACWAASRRFSVPAVPISRPTAEAGMAVAWYVAFMALSAFTFANNMELVNEMTNWLLWVLIPLLLLLAVRRGTSSFRETLSSLGIRREGLGQAIRLALLAAVITVPVSLLAISDAQRWACAPARVATQLCGGTRTWFLLAGLTAGVTEEFFFRGLLQPRLARVLKSEYRGARRHRTDVRDHASALCVLLAGSPDWPTHGNLVWAIVGAISEQALTGVLLGVLWMRTHILAASVLLHTLSNTLVVMPMLKFG